MLHLAGYLVPGVGFEPTTFRMRVTLRHPNLLLQEDLGRAAVVPRPRDGRFKENEMP
jgi:hypothetical protein